MQLTLTRVTATDTDKQGNELKGKYGPFWRVGIQTAEFPDTWINGFTKKKPEWKEGDVVELDVRDEEYNGKMQKKFSFPKKETGVSDEKLETLLNGQVAIRLQLNTIEGLLRGKKEDYPENTEPQPFPDEDKDFSDEIPF